ncbi:putative nuclease HARBI1 [Microplitis demolitor]|uniref:putative nuclease HARBI1 n=1 Tax=Microplitis demolitor TaxID=69319 RepID=UPI00235B64FC|nr:putative nuclease HARBI1 [Microplitis demolitor]
MELEGNGAEINPRNDAPARILNYYEEELENVIRRHIPNNEDDDDNDDDSIPVKKKILLTIWILATPDSFRSVADRFGLPKSTAHLIFTEIVDVLSYLLPQFIRWPDANECEVIEAGFLSKPQGFPGIIGAIDGSHIEILQPPGNANDYYNRKEKHSIILQGTCDHNGKFIDVLIGRPGRAHDASVFRSSTLFTRLADAENPLLRPNQHILGDSAYPLMVNLLTPFKDNGHLTRHQVNYNVKHASSRSIIERAFGLLKGKFRRLQYLNVKSVDMAIKIVSAACTLHNFILIQGDVNIRNNFPGENINNNDNNNDDNGNNNNGMDVDMNEEAENENADAKVKRNNIMNSM